MNKETEERESFESVYSTLFPVLFRVAFHITGSGDVAEELCQEAFIKYFSASAPLPTLNDAKFWLIRVVKNLCYNNEKRKLREKKAYRKLYLTRMVVQEQETGETSVLKDETERLVQKALEALPYKLRMPLVLKEYADMNYRNIAGILGITEGNVKVRIYRARQLLSSFLDKGDLHVS
ncbi:MAG: RNA polymerase sigma factor [Spirochaetales bacterium]|nr:RNA polymerase sigma factor [Spirochaetales bacterium]